jgi:Secretion system C-terminal sorting domain
MAFNKNVITILILLLPHLIFSQSKEGYSWIYGGGGLRANFINSLNKPIVDQLWPSGVNANDYVFLFGHSSICDNNTGRLKFFCNGFRLFDTLGNIIENGDSLVSPKYYSSNNALHFSIFTQSSLIIPKGSNNQYYVFTPSATDSLYDYYKGMSLVDNQRYGVPFNTLHYHIVDMNANSGMGKVIIKNKPLLQNRRLNRVGMQACRHANGTDWWLLKQAEYDSTLVYRFLVTADGITGPDSQVFKQGVCSISDEYGQASFSKDGSKYSYAAARRHKLFIADFDRCSGLLSNAKVVNIRYDSTQSPGDATLGRLDSMVCGTCFSPNDSFIYITTEWNVYQYELHNADSASAWRIIQKGCDTTWQRFGYYGNMLRAVDDNIYIGQGSGNFGGLSVINYPNKKGAACGYCPRCLRDNGGYYSPTSPSNMPDYTLGANPKLCWPTSSVELLAVSYKIKAWPNPASTILNIECGAFKNNDVLEVYNNMGQVVLLQNVHATNVVMNIAHLPNGLYLVWSKYGVVKFLKE